MVDNKTSERKSIAAKSRGSMIGMGSNFALSPKNGPNLLSPKNGASNLLTTSNLMSPKTPVYNNRFKHKSVVSPNNNDI